MKNSFLLLTFLFNISMHIDVKPNSPGYNDNSANLNEQANNITENNSIPNMPHARLDHRMTVVDNNIFIVGGVSFKNNTASMANTMEYYDPIVGVWNKIETKNIPRGSFDLISDDNSITIFGGRDSSENVLNSVEKINVTDGSSTQLTPMLYPRDKHAIVQHKGNIYAIGGREGEARFTIEMFNHLTGEWTLVERLKTPHNPIGAVTDGEFIYIISDTISSAMTGKKILEKYDPVNHNLEYLSDLPTSRCDAPVLLYKNNIIVFGGWTPTGNSSVVEAFNLRDYAWKKLKNMSQRKQFHSAAIYNDAAVITGGAESLFTGAINNVEAYDLSAIVTNINIDDTQPDKFRLGQNYPNPFNPITTISYSISEQAHVEIKVVDILGKEVSSLVNKNQSSGDYQVSFNGETLNSGVYFCYMKANEFFKVNKMLLLK